MKTKALLFSLFTITLIAVGTLITVFFNTSPTTRDVIWLFYAMLLLSCFGLIFLTLQTISYVKNRATPPWQTTATIFRYSSISAVCICILIALSSHKVLNVPSSIAIIIGLVLAELVWRRKSALKS